VLFEFLGEDGNFLIRIDELFAVHLATDFLDPLQSRIGSINSQRE
jgi:hypothetical protein